nr:immunoglobulin heavy chain junction region [Mus musculus]
CARDYYSNYRGNYYYAMDYW